MTPDPSSQSAASLRIFGTGEMAARIRAYPWQDTPLGPITGWPAELTAMVNMMLSTDQMAGVFWGEERTFLYNDAYVSCLTDKHPALGKPYWAIWQEVVQQAIELIESPLRTGKAFVTAALPFMLLRNGVLEQTYFSIAGSPIFAIIDGQHRIGGAYFTYNDETANMLQAQRLADTEARASSVLASIGDAVIVTDSEGKITAFNALAEQLTKWSTADAMGRPAAEVFRLVDGTSREPVESPIDTARRFGRIVNLPSDTVLIAKDGTERYISDSSAPVSEAGGRLSGVVLVFRDTTLARQEQLARERSAAIQEFLLKLTDVQRDAMDGRQIMQVSVEMLARHLDVDRVGYSEASADMKTMHFETSWAQRELQPLSGSVPMDHWSKGTSSDFSRGRAVAYPDVWKEPGLTSEVANYEAIGAIAVLAAPFLRRGVWRGSLYVNHSESRIWTQLEISLVEEVARRTAEAVERAQAEEELRALADRLGMAQEAGQMASWQWDFATDTLTWDGGSEWTYGRPPSEMTHPEEIFSYIHETDREKVRHDLMPAIQGTGEYRSEFRVAWPDESVHWILAFGRTVWSYDGKPTGIVGININVTDQKQIEASLMQTEKLAAVGRLASTIAHEINNPLEAVTNLLYLARNSMSIEEAQPFLETADVELRRASTITNQALRFHKQATRPTLCTFAELTHDLFKGRHSRLTNAHASVEERDRTSRPVMSFEGEIRQVLNNLVTNSIDALTAEGGKLFLRGRDGMDRASGRAGMVITIADTGSGMSPITQKKLFDAFFTTKGVGGTGLGLWVSKEIIERHSGRVRLRSSQREGIRGTVFTIFLPYDAVERSDQAKQIDSAR